MRVPTLAQDDDTIIGWNLFNEPRCNCAPDVIDPNTGAITSENTGSDCANVKQCTADMKVRSIRNEHQIWSRRKHKPWVRRNIGAGLK